jgi:predicted esterase
MIDKQIKKMRKILNKLNLILTTKRVSIALFLLNILSIAFSISFLIVQTYNTIWDIFGIILLITWFGNLLLVYLNSKYINRKTEFGNLINLLGYFYLIFSIFAMYMIIRGNMLITSTYSNNIKDIGRYYGMIYVGIFGLLSFGFILTILNIKNLNGREVITQRTFRRRNHHPILKKNLKKLISFFSYFAFILGIYFALITLLGSFLGLQAPETYNDQMLYAVRFGYLNGVVGMFVALYALAYAFIFLSITILLLKIINRKINPKRYYSIGMIGFILTIIFMLPLCLTPYAVYSAEQNFAQAFGNDWRKDIPNDIEKKYFLQSPFSLPYYFFGLQPKECDIEKGITFYRDGDFKLKFDVYMPKEDKDDLPGEHSILIWIHGGGWSVGDKGGYRIELNKYFAAQGYVVFDIQYGLYDSGRSRSSIGFLTPPEYVKGDFDIDDMVEHIGIFIEYLIYHYEDYDADIDKIFISGGSAGGHLATVSALAIQSGEYEDIFPSNITGNIKGYVPYYPGNRLPELSNIDGKEKFIDPAKLVEKDSPPCLIFQGTNDGLVHPSIAQDFKDAYNNKNNKKCAILWAPLGGHAADIYFNGYYNMVFLYYMERFLYLCVNDAI